LTVVSFDGRPEERRITCTSCGQEYSLITAFVTVEETVSSAIVFAACHGHDRQNEAWLDIVLGPFMAPDFVDNVTFSCRVRSSGADLYLGPVAAEGRTPLFGLTLGPDEARAHVSSGQARDIVNFVVRHEPTLRGWICGRT
jgi:hypothetical protein